MVAPHVRELLKISLMMNNLNASSIMQHKLMDILFSHQLAGFGKITLTHFWGWSGSNYGPDVSCFDENMEIFPDRGMRGFTRVRECNVLFRELLLSDPSLFHSRKVLEDGFLANRLEMTIFPDRRVEMAWSFDSEMDRLELEKAKKYMTQEEIDDAVAKLDEYMQHKGRTRKIRKSPREIKGEAPAPVPVPVPVPAPVPAPATQSGPLNVPDLFKEILVTALNAAPAGWSKLVIDGQVWVETDASGRALNNVSADFQAQMADGSVRQINPPQPIGAMNAFTRLQKELPNLEGKPWRHLRIAFDNGGPEQIAYWFDQGGTWRPES